MSEVEDAEVCEEIVASGCDVLFVALGAPRQEIWMRAHRERLGVFMVGVGAAFEYNAGLIRRAPHWMQRLGLEWLSRFVQQPRRVGRRFASTLPLFAWRLARQILFGSSSVSVRLGTPTVRDIR